jgi:multidrug efflux pump subunit AcrA (membrane-fusion protein)
LQLHEQDRHVYKLPLSAVRAENEKDFFVWRVDKENEKVESVHVELVAIHGKWATVRSTRLADQRIVSSGASLLHEGQRVRVLDDSDD